MRGRKPIPPRLRLLAGNPGRRKPAGEGITPAIEAKPPRPPMFLAPAAKRVWRRLIPEMHRLGLVSTIDVDVFAALCQAYGTLSKAQRTLNKEGLTVKDPDGKIMRHPAVTIVRECMGVIRSLAPEFGMTPSSRARVPMKRGAEEKDELDGFLARSKRAPAR